jgi:chaperonin GroEL (HSP60 family)
MRLSQRSQIAILVLKNLFFDRGRVSRPQHSDHAKLFSRKAINLLDREIAPKNQREKSAKIRAEKYIIIIISINYQVKKIIPKISLNNVLYHGADPQLPLPPCGRQAGKKREITGKCSPAA